MSNFVIATEDATDRKEPVNLDLVERITPVEGEYTFSFTFSSGVSVVYRVAPNVLRQVLASRAGLEEVDDVTPVLPPRGGVR